MPFNTLLLRTMTPALAVCLCAGVATAQNQTDQDRQDREDRQDRQSERQTERQAGQPGDDMDQHPLWRHPVDPSEQWRPQDRWSPSEAREQRDGMSDRSASQDTYRTAYWEGYHDGFHDDEFGYEHWSNEWDRSYSSAYTDGYYDGYYDQQLEYGYDPHYYIYPVAIQYDVEGADREQQAERQRGEQRREQDKVRARGDRMGATAGRSQTMTRDVEQIAALKLIRGDVSSISEAKRSDKPEHTVLRIDFQDRDEILADFGPEMSRQQIPFDRGDRVSLVGYHSKSEKGETIIVSSITHEGRVYKLRGADEALKEHGADLEREGEKKEREGERRLNPRGGG